MSTQQDVDYLLEGLQADDLDMDYDPDEVAFGGTDETAVGTDADLGLDECPPFFAPATSGDMPFVGFVTGRKGAIPAPSSEALARARKILNDEHTRDEVIATPASELATTTATLDRKRPFPNDMAGPSRSVMPKTSGFATASGSRPPPISSAARATTSDLFATSSTGPGHAATAGASRPSGFMTAAGSAPPRASPTALAATAALFRDTAGSSHPSASMVQAMSTPSRPSGLGTAGGRPAPPVSASAAITASRLFHTSAAETEQDWADSGAETIDGFSGRQEGVFSVGFQTGRGIHVPPPSAAARSRALAIFEDPAQDTMSESGPNGPHSTDGHQAGGASEQPTGLPRSVASASSGFSAASGKPAVPLSQSARDRVASLFDDTTTSAPATKSLPAPSPSAAFVTPRPSVAARASATGSTFRTPLRQTTNTPSNLNGTAGLTGSPAPRKFKPIEITSTLGPRRRFGLGITPGRPGKAKTGFTTPFKVGGSAPSATSSLPRTSQSAMAGPSKPRAPEAQPVFNLTAPSHRKSYREAYLKPQYYTPAELAEHNIPEELGMINLATAKAYHFPDDSGGYCGPTEALLALKAAGCALATQKWVVNHWSMILWKLAGIIQAQYTLYDSKWCWDEVLSQLFYRYEREYNRAERPIIRRIHEHDSSPALPLILCVSAILYPPPGIEPDAQEPGAMRPVVELTDGWYRISAQIDDCLARGVKKGKIKVGQKLAVTGAKLEGGSEGVDALEEADKSLMTISGNSTCLASWDAKLGRQRYPFVAGLSSLSLDGGMVTLMDVIIDKVFPLAFTPAEKGVKDGPWDEEEERRRSDAWKEKYTTESSRLQVEAQKQLERLEDIVSAICSAAEGVEDTRAGRSSPGNIDSLFDSILEAKNLNASLRTIPAGSLLHLASYSRGYYEREASNGNAEIEAELQVLCPERQVRDFRIVRIRDARRGDRPAFRSGMLNVWDAKALGEGALQEGKRYLVANVMPGKAGEWRPTKPKQDGTKYEIYLHTRKDTRWQVVEE